MLRQALFAVVVARSRSAVYPNTPEFTVSLKNTGPIKLWLDMATKVVTFPL